MMKYVRSKIGVLTQRLGHYDVIVVDTTSLTEYDIDRPPPPSPKQPFILNGSPYNSTFALLLTVQNYPFYSLRNHL